MSGYNAEHARRYNQSEKGRIGNRRRSAEFRERHRDEINRKRREKAAIERENRRKTTPTIERKVAAAVITSTIAERAKRAASAPPAPKPVVPLEQVVRRPAAEVKAEFEYYLGEASANGWKPNCYKEPEEFTDFDPKHPPTADEAEMLCWRCPLLEICDEYARTVKPEIGIHGGRVWVNKKLVSGRKRRRRTQPAPALASAA